MTTANISKKDTTSLKEQLEKLAAQGFTGKLEISAIQRKWDIFFCLGRLAWATGGDFPQRRFRRVWRQHGLQNGNKMLSEFSLMKSRSAICEHYEFFRTAAKQNQFDRRRITAIVGSNCQEVFFDILQQEAWELLSYQALPETGLDKTSLLMSGLLWPKQVFPEAYQEWLAWQKAGLQNISPHQIPAIAQPQKLQQMTSPGTYSVLTKAIDGRRSLWDLAIATQKELWRLGKALLPYIQQGIIKLKTVEAADGDEDTTGAIASVGQSATPPSKPFCIACIDDSSYIHQQMEHIATQVGWRFVAIEDSVKAVPILLESSPDLIFLDLVMPVANGYEVCAQIRRVEVLKSVPVVILTSQGGVINNTRARLAGANAFLNKPIQPAQIIAIAQRLVSQ